MRPRQQGSAHDVILTGLDEEGDSTNKEMPPLEPLEGAAREAHLDVGLID